LRWYSSERIDQAAGSATDKIPAKGVIASVVCGLMVICLSSILWRMIIIVSY
jgi:hypothetical protein